MNKITCSGGMFLAKSTQKFLLLLRTQGKTAGTWGLAGGKKEPLDITPHDVLMREISEEIGFVPNIIKTVPLELYSSNDNMFNYHTYVIIVNDEFIPKLNQEHSGYAWVEMNMWPRPLHNGLKTTLNSRIIRNKLQTILDVIS